MMKCLKLDYNFHNNNKNKLVTFNRWNRLCIYLLSRSKSYRRRLASTLQANTHFALLDERSYKLIVFKIVVCFYTGIIIIKIITILLYSYILQNICLYCIYIQQSIDYLNSGFINRVSNYSNLYQPLIISIFKKSYGINMNYVFYYRKKRSKT